MILTFPTNAELKKIEQIKLPTLTNNDPAFTMFPIVQQNTSVVMWEQLDNFTGLQSLRGLNGEPTRVSRVGMKRFSYEPGTYGEFAEIDEAVLTRKRDMGTFGSTISLDSEIVQLQDQLLNREIDRIRYIIWKLLTTGTFEIATGDGSVIHKDSYSMQTQSAAVAWTTFATASPIKDMRELKLRQRGQSVSFGPDAKAYANQKTINALLANTNANDLGGKRLENGANINDLGGINRILVANDVPQFEVYDEGYLDDTGTFVPFIADGRVIVIGKRTNSQILGEYIMTRNANNPDAAPGSYTRVIDHGERTVPRKIEVHQGHNGGPAIYFPGAVVIFEAY